MGNAEFNSNTGTWDMYINQSKLYKEFKGHEAIHFEAVMNDPSIPVIEGINNRKGTLSDFGVAPIEK